jgi:hypothetical protein
MTFKIERISGKRRTRIRLSGAFRSEHSGQLKAEIERGGPRIALTLEDTSMKSIARLFTAVAVMFAVTTLCRAQDVKPVDLGKGAAFNGKTIEMKDRDEVAYLLSFTSGKEFEATTDGPKNTDVHLFVYDTSGKEVAKDDSPGPKCSVKVTPKKDGEYKFVIKNAGGANTVTFKVEVAK